MRNEVQQQFKNVMYIHDIAGPAAFRRALITWIMKQYNCSFPVACTHYNFAYAMSKKG